MAKKESKQERICSPMEQAFCRYYADPQSETYGESTKSAARAGFAEKSARTTAWKLLRRGRVKARLKEIYAETDFSPERVMSNIESDRLRALAKGDLAVAVRCDELLGKRLGLFSDRLITSQEEPGRERELSEAERKEAIRLARVLTLPQRDDEQPDVVEYPGGESDTDAA